MLSVSTFLDRIQTRAHHTAQPYIAFLSCICFTLLLLMTLPGLKGVSLDGVYVYRYAASQTVSYNAYLFNYCQLTTTTDYAGKKVTSKTCSGSDTSFWLNIKNLPAIGTSSLSARSEEDLPKVEELSIKVEEELPTNVVEQLPTKVKRQTIWWTPETTISTSVIPTSTATATSSATAAAASATSTSSTLAHSLTLLKTNVTLLKAILLTSTFLLFIALVLTLYLYAKPDDLVGRVWAGASLLCLFTAGVLWAVAVFVAKARIASALASLAVLGYSQGYTALGEGAGTAVLSYLYMVFVCQLCVLAGYCGYKVFGE